MLSCLANCFYVSIVWSNTSNNNIKKQQLVQNFAYVEFLICRVISQIGLHDDQVYNRSARYSNNLNLLKRRLTTGQRAFAYRGAKMFNELRNNIKQVDIKMSQKMSV